MRLRSVPPCPRGNVECEKLTVKLSMKTLQKIDIIELNGDTPGNARGIGWSPPAGNYQSPLPALCILSGGTESMGPPGLRAAKCFIHFS